MSKDTDKYFKKNSLPDYIEPAMNFAVGWPSIRGIKSTWTPLKKIMVPRKKQKG